MIIAHKHKTSGCLGWFIVIIVIVAIGCMSCSTQREGCKHRDISTKKFTK
jgi:hypothetical protein